MDFQYIKESDVKSLLNWDECFLAIKQALLAVLNDPGDDHPTSSESTRTFTFTSERKGVLLTMPGFIGNYQLWDKKESTLACKLVTSFSENKSPLPKIMATILLFDSETGKLRSVVEGTEITAWRTAATSLVATKFLFFDQPQNYGEKITLSIIGCGTQVKLPLLLSC